VPLNINASHAGPRAAVAARARGAHSARVRSSESRGLTYTTEGTHGERILARFRVISPFHPPAAVQGRVLQACKQSGHGPEPAIRPDHCEVARACGCGCRFGGWGHLRVPRQSLGRRSCAGGTAARPRRRSTRGSGWPTARPHPPRRRYAGPRGAAFPLALWRAALGAAHPPDSE
jgi:hypothetical protein